MDQTVSQIINNYREEKRRERHTAHLFYMDALFSGHYKNLAVITRRIDAVNAQLDASYAIGFRLAKEGLLS